MEISQNVFDLRPGGQFTNLENISIPSLVSLAVSVALVVATVLFFFSFLIGGIKFIVSGGKKDHIDEAKNQILSAFVGILIVFSTWALIGYVNEFFGLDILTLEFPAIQ